jgi:hypothetical protein
MGGQSGILSLLPTPYGALRWHGSVVLLRTLCSTPLGSAPTAPPALTLMASATPSHTNLMSPAALSQGQLKRERLRFTNFRFVRTPSGLCTAEVELEWLDGVTVVGKASGQSSPMGDLRIAAEAALRALESFSGGAIEFELAGVKALRAFDANIVIVALGVRKGEGPQRLLGSYLAERDPVRAAVISVLNATNRLLGNFIATR